MNQGIGWKWVDLASQEGAKQDRLIPQTQFPCYFLFYQERNQGVGWNWVEWVSWEGGSRQDGIV
jgi:hypothetical protein